MNKKRIIEILKVALCFLSFVFVPSLIMVLLNALGMKNELYLNFFTELIYLLILVVAFKDTLKKDLKTFKKKNFKIMLKWWLIGIIVMVASNAVINFVIFGGEIAANESQNREILTSIPIIGLVLGGVLAPLVEELTFRRGFKNVSKNKWIFIFTSSFFFALLHVTTGLFTSYDPLTIDFRQLLYFIPYGSLAVSFAIIYSETNNIYSSIITHAIHNTLTLLLILSVYGL